MNIKTVKPDFGGNYDLGYIGFTSRTDDLVAAGIAWFERWDDRASSPYPKITVEHALVVSGENECIEAHAVTGVSRSDLTKYFRDKHCHIFFRKPVGWSLRRGEGIVAAAKDHLGESYGYGLIVADLLANTYFGRWLNRWTRNVPNRIVSKFCDAAGTEVCSELAAKALQAQPWLRERGCLRQPARTVTPQALFEDRRVFYDWKNIPAVK